MSRRPFVAHASAPARALSVACALGLAVSGCYTPTGRQDPPLGDKEDREVGRVYNRHVGAGLDPDPVHANVRISVVRYQVDAAEAALFDAAWQQVGFGPQEILTTNGLRIGTGGDKFAALFAAALAQAKTLKKTDSWVTVPDKGRTTYGLTKPVGTATFTWQDAAGIQKDLALAQARLRVEIAPEILPDRFVRLTLTPSVQYSEKTEKSLTLKDLRVHLSVSDGDAIVIGPTAEVKPTVGGVFLGSAPDAPGARTIILLKPQRF